MPFWFDQIVLTRRLYRERQNISRTFYYLLKIWNKTVGIRLISIKTLILAVDQVL